MAASATADILEARASIPCVWCKQEAENRVKWVSINGKPRIPLCSRCHDDVERIAQAMIVLGKYVLPRMTKR